MKRMFLLFALSVLCCLLFPAAAQERLYTVTETELIRLEGISENLAKDKQNLQSQASSLTERLRGQEKKAKTLAVSLLEAESKANTLNSQLQTERETLKALRQSYNAYELEAAETIAEKQALIDEQKDKLYRRMMVIIMLLTVLAAVVVIGIVKGKKIFSLFL
ncbi:hypothetical protein [Treponema sp.]|uniref:hypothetical protein n=1 Tax=Treponema sp. TaxID=166 RepID=UPI003FA33BAA